MKGNKKEKFRLDQLLVNLGLAETRNKAQGMIMAGIVRVGERIVIKSGEKFAPGVNIEIVKMPHPYVSRGGLKLEKALDYLGIDVRGKICLDAGSSTGGFTHCLLLKGALKVYSIDVGYGQIALILREDPRVKLIEKCNVRYLSRTQVPENVDIITCDLSFISLTKVMEHLKSFLKDGGYFISLIKPQFEAGIKDVKKGIVRDATVREEAVRKIVEFAQSINLKNLGVIESPITGSNGNIEYLGCFLK